MNKIEKLRQERKEVIKEYSSKKIENHSNDILTSMKELQYVRVSEIIEETHDTKSFILVPDKEKGTFDLAPFKAGQYINVKIMIDNSFVTRAYSIASSPADALKNFYKITIKRVKDGFLSNYMLDDIKVNDALEISRPAGEFYYNKNRDEKNVIAVAGGSGITPFISMAYAVLDNIEDFNLTVFYSVRKEEDIIFKKEIEAINKKSKKVQFIITLTKEKKKD